MRRPGPVRAFLLDVEGVLVRDKRYEPVAGAREWFAAAAAAGLPFRLVSNNTTHAPDALVARLAGIGFPVAQEHLVGALDTGRRWLARRARRRLLWLGHARLEPWWRASGFTLVDAPPCDAVVLGVNPALAPADLERALPALLDDGTDVVCLHRNAFWLDEEGRRRLGPGAWAAALEAVGGRGAFITVGKPAETVYREALKSIGVPAGEALFISDDPEADLVTAGRLGLHTAFVLSGKHADCAVLSRLDQEDWPDVVCGSLADIDPTRPLAGGHSAPRD